LHSCYLLGVKASRALRDARHRAGLSQRDLAERTGTPQSTIGRIESGAVDPRTGTLVGLIRACGSDLEIGPLLGQGIDRTLIRECLALSPGERIARLTVSANFLQKLRAARRLAASRRK
jgi:predicted transcriptional regulator